MSEGLPPLFVERFQRIVPTDQSAELLATFGLIRPISFRLNPLQAPLHTTISSLREKSFALSPISWCEHAYLIPAEQKQALTQSAEFTQGHLYIQSLSSILATLILDPQPHEQVLDLAAAPGGKTTHIATQMGNQGKIVAVEVGRDRFFRLKANLAQQGVSIAQIIRQDGRTLSRAWHNHFDRVLLDAPCSSEARFDTHNPTSWAHWRVQKVRESAYKQRGLLATALATTKIGGTLLYCTCSFAPEENEEVVNDVLRKFAGEVEIRPIDLPISNQQAGLTAWGKATFSAELANTRRILPNQSMEGFFLALLQRHT